MATTPVSQKQIQEKLNELGEQAESKDWRWIAQQMSEFLGKKGASLLLSDAFSNSFDWSSRRQWVKQLSNYPIPDHWLGQVARCDTLPNEAVIRLAQLFASRENLTLGDAYHWARALPDELASARPLPRIPALPLGEGRRELQERAFPTPGVKADVKRLWTRVKKRLNVNISI